MILYEAHQGPCYVDSPCCSWRPFWCSWSVPLQESMWSTLPSKSMWMSLAFAAAGTSVDICGPCPCFIWRSFGHPQSVPLPAQDHVVDLLPADTILMSMLCPSAVLKSVICIATGDHANVCGLCWCQRPRGCSWSMLLWGTMWKSIIHTATGCKGQRSFFCSGINVCRFKVANPK